MYLAVLFFFLLYTTNIADALRCLQCDGVLTPLLCDRVTHCQDNEMCLAEKYITKNNEVLYNVGCYSNATCKTTTHPQQGHLHLHTSHNTNDVLQCSYCCGTDACNKNTCGTLDFNVKHGPICLDCQQTQHPGSCSYVKTCEQHEVCRIQEMTRLGIPFYSLSCTSGSTCLGYHGTAFGKRRREVEATSHCCDTDLCNDEQVTESQPVDCTAIKQHGTHKSGVYTVYPGKRGPKHVYCDMSTSGGGWTIIHSRINNTLHWNRSWEEYKTGFGNANGDYWIGNEYMYLLTMNRPSEIYFKLQSTNGRRYYAVYRGFAVGPESDGFRLAYNGTSYTGNAGDALYVCSGYTDYHNGLKFSTYDRDNDKSYYNCAGEHGGGWWHKSCDVVLLTATGGQNQWHCDLGFHIKASVMMIRPST